MFIKAHSKEQSKVCGKEWPDKTQGAARHKARAKEQGIKAEAQQDIL